MITRIKQDYHNWLCNLVCTTKHLSFNKLMDFLHNTPFVYYMPMDDNRASDGTDLRYRFGEALNIPQPIVAMELDDEQCSMLEMLVALAVRCETQIMFDETKGDRTSYWFWIMMANLGIDQMNDEQFNPSRVGQAMNRLIERNYYPDGKYGLFHVRNFDGDMRSMEIWYQMCAFLNSYVRTREENYG